MKQGIEKIMQERWGFAHHQKTMLVDQDWHGQRYLTAYMGTQFELMFQSHVVCHCITSSYVPVQMPIAPSVRAYAERLAFCLGPANQHALVLFVLVSVSVSVFVTLQMCTAVTASSICLMTFGTTFPSSDQSNMLLHVHFDLLDAISDN